MNFQQAAVAVLATVAWVAAPSASAQTDLLPITEPSAAQANPPVLNLFEAVEVNEPRASSPTSRPTRESRATSSEPLFTLIGTSRIGSRMSALLRHQNGENIRLAVSSGNATPITGYEEYSVFDVGSGKLSVRYPSNIPCVDHKEKGVSCGGSGNTAQLQLVNAEAIVRAEPKPQEPSPAIIEAGQAGSDSGAATSNPNPFEALRQARAEGRGGAGQSSENNRFTPRRIAPEDVPPGMRIVSTPFGDRLVEE
ncbi:MAG: hypothetical protein AB8B95_15870 [Pseudohongiellaceae bacterium]